MDFKNYFSKQDELWEEIQRLDDFCKRNNKIIGRYLISTWTDRVTIYIVVEKISNNYLLRYALGESQNPNWGFEILKPKKEVKKTIKGRDKLKKIFS